MAIINHPSFRKYFANTSWLLVERILRMGITLLVGIYVARYLEPERFGQLSYALSFVSFFSAIALIGLEHTLIRELVKGETDSKVLLGSSFRLKLFGALIAILLIIISVTFTSNSQEENIIVFIIAAGFLFQSATVIDYYYQSRVQSKYVVYTQIVQLVISSIAKLLLVWGNASLVWFAVVTAVDSLIFAVGLILVYLHTGHNPRDWCYNHNTAKILLRDSWPLMLSAVAISIYMKVDQVMIKEMMGAEAVGYYAAAVRLSEAWYFIPLAITASLFPAIINAKERSDEHYYDQLQKLFNVMVWLAVAIALPVTFLSDWIIMLLFGQAFAQAGDVLSIHIWAGVFVFISCAIGRSLVVENNQKLNLYRNILGLIVNFGLNILLIPMFGIKGAAFSTLISYSVSAYFVMPFFVSGRKQFMLATRSLFPLKILMAKRGNI
jgi:O-antigen/teichoic acid export membrane protein